jgi:putative methylase
MDRATVERALSDLRSFSDPDPALEQYPTPADLAAHLVHLADLQGDLRRPVADLGSGTGVLALGAALKSARVVGVERDPAAIATAHENTSRLDPPRDPTWLLGDAARPPLAGPVTVLANPPFGAQSASRGDRPFLETAADIAAVSLTVHNAGSREFLAAFVDDNGGAITHVFRADLAVDRQFDFHDRDRTTVETVVVRVDWRGDR